MKEIEKLTRPQKDAFDNLLAQELNIPSENCSADTCAVEVHGDEIINSKTQKEG